MEPHLYSYAQLTNPQEIKREILKLRMCLKRRIDPQKGCWIWTGATDGDGLGLIKVRSVKVIIHRLAIALWKGIILNRGQVAIRTCGTKDCFHPDHREIWSRAELRRAAARKSAAQPGSKRQIVTGN